MIKELAQQYVAKRSYKPGETVQFGWFIFRITDNAQPPEIESLDFKEIASYTTDFSAVEQIHALQRSALARCGWEEEECVLWHSAVVSLSYSPGRQDAFLKRDVPTDANDSGWYVGVFEELRNMGDATSFLRRSLYELTIRDMKMAPFWLLPRGTVVRLATGEIGRGFLSTEHGETAG
jgi:hypothetical protein